MQTKTQQILSVLQVLSWIMYIGYIIIGVATLIRVILLFIPGTAINLFWLETLDSAEIKNQWPPIYLFGEIFSIIMAYLYIELWLGIKNLLTKINLEKPFDLGIAFTIEKIAYKLFSIWVIGLIGYQIFDISNNTNNLGIDSDTKFLMIAGIVYIISQVFKRGIEIQEENKLTV